MYFKNTIFLQLCDKLFGLFCLTESREAFILNTFVYLTTSNLYLKSFCYFYPVPGFKWLLKHDKNRGLKI